MSSQQAVIDQRAGSQQGLETMIVDYLKLWDNEEKEWRIGAVRIAEEILEDDLTTDPAGVKAWAISFCEAHGLEYRIAQETGSYIITRKDGRL